MSRSADEGKNAGYGGYRGNKRHGHARSSRGRSYNYPYHKNELEYYEQLSRPRSTSPIDRSYPPPPPFNNGQQPSNNFMYHGSQHLPYRQKNFSGFRRNFGDPGDGRPQYAQHNYSYDLGPVSEGHGAYQSDRDGGYYGHRQNWNRRRSSDVDLRDYGGPPPPRDWQPPGGQRNYLTENSAGFHSSPEHHSESYDSGDSDIRETSDTYSNTDGQASSRKSPSRRKRYPGKKNLEKKQLNLESPQPPGNSLSSVSSESLDATVQKLQSQVQWLQQLSQLNMMVSPTLVPGMAATPVYPTMLPNFQQPSSACASCHLGGVDLMRHLAIGPGFPPTTPATVPSIAQGSFTTPAGGQESSHDLLAMLRQGGEQLAATSSHPPCPECLSTTGCCSCTEDEPTSLEPQQRQLDRNKMAAASMSRVAEISTSSPVVLPQTPIRSMSTPIRMGSLGPTQQTPLHSLLAHLNESMTALQFQSPDRASSKDDKYDGLPPIGVFWDIENCAVPSGKSAFEVVRRIRDRFFEGHREAEFMCVCDIKKENAAVIEELNNAQVTVAHINAVAKNAADDKLKQSLRRFADTHSRPATVVLISGDINFAHDLSDLRHRHGLNVILVHKSDSSEALKSCANNTIKYAELIADLPSRSPSKQPGFSDGNQLFIRNLPSKRNISQSQVRNRLEQLSDNCGGKVSHVSNNVAVMKFPNQESASRAKKRLEGEDVFGSQISVSFQRNGSFNSPKTFNKDNRRRSSNSFSEDLLRNNSRQDLGATLETGEEGEPSPARGLPEVVRQQVTTNKETNRAPGSPLTTANMGPYQKKIPNWSSLPSAQFRPLPERSYSPYSMNNGSDLRYRRSPAGDAAAGHFRSIPNVQRVTPPLNQTIFLPDGGISPLPMKGTYRAPTPIQVASNQTKNNWEPPPGVDLLVTNLDNKMTRKELKRLLSASIGRYAQVLHMKLFAPTQGHFQATVRVPTQRDAVRTLLKVSGAQIGSWKIEICLLPASDSNADKLRQMVVPVLQGSGRFSMPLVEFKRAFQQKYDQIVYTYDLYQIPETVTLRDTTSGKTISLSAQSRPETPNVTGYMSNSSRQSPMIPTRDSTPQPCARWCPIHIKDISKVVVEECVTINITVSLRTFGAQVLTLLEMHNGAISLASFPVCYSAEYTFTKDQYGVPIEHLLSCLKDVHVVLGHDTFKYICLSPKKQQTEEGDGNPPLLPQPLFTFSREAIEMLKHAPLCRIDYNKFATEYHHKFAKQCRVADYGFLKLSELFEAVAQCVQVIGEEDSKIIMLSHQTQMKRFAQDLLKVLRSQASKQVTFREFPIAFQRMFGRPFLPAEYGLCYLQDLVSELPEETVVIEGGGEDTMLSIPRREQSEEELMKCKKFGREVVELLSREPHHAISFGRFIPAYHRFFNRQCKVGEYGVNKLMELFEALPKVVKITDDIEKSIILSEAERLASLCQMVNHFLPTTRDRAIPTASIAPTFMKYYGWCPNWQELGLHNCRHLLSKFPHVMEIFNDSFSERVFSVEHQQLNQLTHQVLVVLLDTPLGRLSLPEFSAKYQTTWQASLIATEYGYSQLVLLLKALYHVVMAPLIATEYNYSQLVLLLKSLHHVVMVREEWSDNCEVELTSTYQFARHASVVLKNTVQRALTVEHFCQEYRTMYERELVPSDFGHTTIVSLISAVPWVLSLIGKGNRRLVSLNELIPAPVPSVHVDAAVMTGDISSDSAIVKMGQVTGMLPPDRQISSDSSSSTSSASDLMKSSPKKLSPTELLCERPASNIPSTILEPVSAPLPIRDLISFESPRNTPPDQHQPLLGQHLLDSSFSTTSPHVRNGSSSTSQDPPTSSLPSSIAHSLSQREDFADYSSLPSSSLSSPLRSPTRARSRSQVKLAVKFQSGPLGKKC